LTFYAASRPSCAFRHNPTLVLNIDFTQSLCTTQLRTEHLPRLSNEEQLQPLKKALASASSSLSVPHVDYSGSSISLLDSLAAAAGSSETELRVVGTCGGALAKGDVADAVQQLHSNTTGVIVVCAQVSADLKEEMELLEELTVGLLSSL